MGYPYLISAFSSPFLGFGVDKIGKRAVLISLSSVILITGFLFSMLLPGCDQCNNELTPLILTGVGYSIYASAIWGSIPYVVTPQTVGTAFGICTAVQNIGLVIAPTVVGFIQEKTSDNMFGYYWVNFFFVGVNVIGLILNLTLYFLDIKYYDSVLDKVDKGTRVTELISTPPANKSRKDLLRESLKAGTRAS